MEHTAESTFRTRRDADAYLAAIRADLDRDTWIDPVAGQVALATYAWKWLDERPGLRPRTCELYESELRLHILPALGSIEVAKLTTAAVRSWHAQLLKAGRPGPTTVAKCYRLLRAILTTAVEDGLVLKNPCIIKGAGVEHHEERPTASVEQVFEIGEAIGTRYRAMVLLAGFTGLRLGELLGLTRRNLDLSEATVTVVGQVQELGTGGLFRGPPKSDAGRRTVAIPHVLLPTLASHLETWVEPCPDALVFGRGDGRPLRRATLHKAWRSAVAAVGLESLHFHDLRHTGNTLAAATGASTKELMARMGHSSPRAALIYQHATKERDAAIARALSETITSVIPASTIQLHAGAVNGSQ